MKKDEQHRMIISLRDHRARMDKEEHAEFEMLMKRDRDDEEFDTGSLQSLNQLFAKYVAKRSRDELEERWKKLTGG